MNKESLLELSDTLRGIAEGKAWECTKSAAGEWSDPDHLGPIECLTYDREIRLKPWSLPKPPEGLEWHREDGWTEVMLAGGWRPQYVGETGNEYECSLDGIVWQQGGLQQTPMPKSSAAYCRTKAPLPAPKKKQKVRLGPADVPPGSVISCANDYWEMVTELSPEWIRISGRHDRIEWGELLAYWKIKRPGEDWQPCYKEVEVEA